MYSCGATPYHGGGGYGGFPSGGHKVKVAVRFRPFIEREEKEGAKNNWMVTPNQVLHIDPETNEEKLHKEQFMFDNVFAPEATTMEVYEKIVSPIVGEAFNGFNGTVLCYGQTSSGKTHTLYGNETDPGIISFLAEDIQRRIQNAPTGKVVIRLNLIEIYNENVRDLLCSENPIEIVERDGNVIPAKAEHIDIFCGDDIIVAAQRLQRERRLGETRMNTHSSRSHTILRMSINTFFESEDDAPTSNENGVIDEEGTTGTGKRIVSAVLNFVDLAGSEKASQSGASGERLREAGHINTSLSALSRVVNQLSKQWELMNKREGLLLAFASADSKMPRSRMPQNYHISYRDSKLTRLLQSSLAGGALIAIICNATPASSDETLSTLRFALSAKEIQTKPKRNLITDKVDKQQYENMIMELQAELFGKNEELKILRQALLSEQSVTNSLQDALTAAKENKSSAATSTDDLVAASQQWEGDVLVEELHILTSNLEVLKTELENQKRDHCTELEQQKEKWEEALFEKDEEILKLVEEKENQDHEKQIKELQELLAKKEEEISTLRTKEPRKSNSNMIQELQAELFGKNEELEILRQALLSEQSVTNSLQDALTAAKENKSSAATSTDDLVAASQQWEKDMAEKLHILSSKVEQFQTELEKQKREHCNELEQEKEKWEEALFEKYEEMLKLEEENQDHEKQIKELRDLLAKKEEEISTLRTKESRKSNQNMIQELQAELLGKNEELEILRQALLSEQSVTNSLQAELFGKNEELEILRQALLSEQSVTNSLQAELFGKNEELKILRQALLSEQSVTNSLQDALTAAKENKSSTGTSTDDLVAASQQREKDMDEKVHILSSKVEQLQTELEKQKREHFNELEQQKEKGKEALFEKDEEMLKLDEENRVLQATISNLRQNSQNVNTKYNESLKEELKKSWKENQDHEKQIKDLKHLLVKKEEEILTLKSKEPQKSNPLEDFELFKLRKEVQELKQVKDQSVNTLASMELQLKEAQSKIKTLDEEGQKSSALKPTRTNAKSLQTPNEWDESENARRYLAQAKILAREKEKLISEKDAADREIKKRDQKAKDQEVKIQQLQDSIKEIHRKLSGVANRGKVDSGIQCEYIKDLVQRSKNGENVRLPPEFPDLSQLEAELRSLKGKIFTYESRCQCGGASSDGRKRKINQGDLALNFKKNSSVPEKHESDSDNARKFVSKMGTTMDRKGNSVGFMFPKASPYLLRSKATAAIGASHGNSGATQLPPPLSPKKRPPPAKERETAVQQQSLSDATSSDEPSRTRRGNSPSRKRVRRSKSPTPGTSKASQPNSTVSSVITKTDDKYQAKLGDFLDWITQKHSLPDSDDEV